MTDTEILTKAIEKAVKRCSWTYTHYLNSRSATRITKHGNYYGKRKHTRRYRGEQLAYVQFDGNKRVSFVPFSELRFL